MSRVPTRITHIITGLGVGGAERALHTLLTSGLAANFEHTVISLTGEGYYGPLLRAAGIPVACMNMTPGRPTLGAALRLRRAVRVARPDILQGWMYHGNVAASLVCRLSSPRAALVWNIRMSLEGTRQMKISTRAVIRIGAWLSKAPDAIIYNAARARGQHELAGYASAAARVIPNGFDTRRWHPNPTARASLRQELNLAADAPVVGFVGRGQPEKDLVNLLSAFTAATATRPDVRLVCVGRDLEQYAHHLDPARVIFLGQRNDIERLMPAFDVLCLSSYFEGFPNVLGEAMACGVPCATTDVGDAAAIVGETGWIARPRDSAALANALSLALNATPEERQARGRLARARVEAHYSLDAIVGEYAALYARLARRT